MAEFEKNVRGDVGDEMKKGFYIYDGKVKITLEQHLFWLSENKTFWQYWNAFLNLSCDILSLVAHLFNHQKCTSESKCMKYCKWCIVHTSELTCMIKVPISVLCHVSSFTFMLRLYFLKECCYSPRVGSRNSEQEW